jgi:hypothetical protein
VRFKSAEVTKRVKDRLCDKCLAQYEADPNFPLDQLCKPCQDRLINMCYEYIDEVSKELADMEDAIERGIIEE